MTTMTLEMALSAIDRSIRALREAGYTEQAAELTEARAPISRQFAHIAKPAQAVDVGAIKTLIELVEGDHGGGHTEADCRYCVAVNTITRAIGNAAHLSENGHE